MRKNVFSIRCFFQKYAQWAYSYRFFIGKSFFSLENGRHLFFGERKAPDGFRRKERVVDKKEKAE
jgi:hypothetical protein